MSARYGAVVALDQVSFAIDSGERVAVTGSNGSGKSTLLRCLLGLHPLNGGGIRLDGEAARRRADWRRRRRLVAYVPQRPATGAFPLLVREVLDSAGAPAAARDAASALGIATLLDRPLHTLSGGQLQRTVIARGLACTHDGAVALVADEPTSALDFDGQDEVAALLTELAVTVLIVSHEPALVARCDRVIEMAGGRIRERSR